MSEFVRTPSNLLGAMFQVSEVPASPPSANIRGALASLSFRQIWMPG